jgi:hypothetical protein
VKKNILEIYALLVCLITITIAVVSIGTAAYDAIRVANPTFTINRYQYDQYVSNDKYVERNLKDKALPSDEEITRRRQEGLKFSIQEEQRDGFQSLTKSFIAIFLNAIIFGIHWKLAKRARISN